MSVVVLLPRQLPQVGSRRSCWRGSAGRWPTCRRHAGSGTALHWPSAARHMCRFAPLYSSKVTQRSLPMTWPCARQTQHCRGAEMGWGLWPQCLRAVVGIPQCVGRTEQVPMLQAAVSGACGVAASTEGRDGKARAPREARSRRWPAMQRSASLSSPLPSVLPKAQVSSMMLLYLDHLNWAFFLARV